MDLTGPERAFLVSQKIKPDHVLDARGMSKEQWTARAKAEGILFILGSPCDAVGHRLRTRAGHCMQCNTATIAYIRRFAEPGHVYIAASKTTRLLKVGSCKDIGQRERNLRAHKYGGATDWQIIAWAKTPRAGELEFDIQRMLAGVTVEGSYEKDGRIQRTRELLRGDLVKVWQAYHAKTEKIEAGKKWRYAGFQNFNFAAQPSGGPAL